MTTAFRKARTAPGIRLEKAAEAARSIAAAREAAASDARRKDIASWGPDGLTWSGRQWSSTDAIPEDEKDRQTGVMLAEFVYQLGLEGDPLIPRLLSQDRFTEETGEWDSGVSTREIVGHIFACARQRKAAAEGKVAAEGKK